MKLPGIDWSKLSAKRVEEGENWTILHGDSLRIVRELPAECVDAVYTDPPYSSGGFTRGDRSKETGKKYMDSGASRENQVLTDFEGDNRDQRAFLAWLGLVLWDVRAATKKGGLGFVFTDWRQLPATSDAFQVGGWIWRGVFVWDKLGCHRRAGYGRFSARHEFGVWGSNGPLEYLTTAPADGREMLEGSLGCGPVAGLKRKHVTQKPKELGAYIARAAPKGGVILDPFMGVGTTGAGALSVGRRFVGIELDANAFDYTAKRLAVEEKKMRESAQ